LRHDYFFLSFLFIYDFAVFLYAESIIFIQLNTGFTFCSIFKKKKMTIRDMKWFLE